MYNLHIKSNYSNNPWHACFLYNQTGLTPSIHPSVRQPFGVSSIPASVSRLASGHTLHPTFRPFHLSLSSGLLTAGGCSRSVTGCPGCHSLCVCTCVSMCVCVRGRRKREREGCEGSCHAVSGSYAGCQTCCKETDI